MSDITASTPAVASPSPASAPSPAPSSSEAPEPTSNAELAHMAEPEDASEYVEQRHADEGHSEADATGEQRKSNRHERHRRAIEKLKAENAELRAAQEPAPDQDVPTTTATEGEEVETVEQFAERIGKEIDAEIDAEVEHKTQTRLHDDRRREASQRLPHFDRVLANGAQVPTDFAELVIESPVSADIEYLLCLPQSQAANAQLAKLSPRDRVRRFYQLEAIVAQAKQQAAQQQQRGATRPQPKQHRLVTAARPPIPLLKGGSGPSVTVHDLGNRAGDDASSYIQRRQQQMKGR